MKYDVIVIGSGAAGYSAGDWLYKYGITDIAIITEGKNFGTSRNTGSDKQTYYKLSLDGMALDSAQNMAKDICSGGACDGELAYIEATNSLRCFYRLVEYGVEFPSDNYGGYVGYRTDHDERKRATSIGPLTSKEMTERLEERVLKNNGTQLIDNSLVIRIITDNGEAKGVILYDKVEKKLKKITAGAVVVATGGPASVYAKSVYPTSQRGMTGVLLNAGVDLVNFSEWQYGIASLKFRWNLSGSFMQVIPRIFSQDADGKEREFLIDALGADVYKETFLKGYQWPFDVNKMSGSSRVDLAIQGEINLGNRVFLDYRKNPSSFSVGELPEEALSYLKNSNALADTPLKRLKSLNERAIKVFADNGIDLSYEPLEIGICAQHNNGGVLVDLNYMSKIKNLFVIGEAAGVFGITRQGGTALNSTQVGGLRVAQYLRDNTPVKPFKDYGKVLEEEQEKLNKFEILETKDYSNITSRMSKFAGFVRDNKEMVTLLKDVENALLNHNGHIDVESYYQDFDMLTCAKALLKSILQTMDKCGSRGGAIYSIDKVIVPEKVEYRAYRAIYSDGTIKFEKVKPVPSTSVWFEELLKENK